MQYLYILTLSEQYRNPANWTEDINRIQGEHFNYLKALFEKGVMKHVGRTDVSFDSSDLHGYAVFEAENEAAAISLMSGDPAISNGIMTARLLPYKIVFG